MSTEIKNKSVTLKTIRVFELIDFVETKFVPEANLRFPRIPADFDNLKDFLNCRRAKIKFSQAIEDYSKKKKEFEEKFTKEATPFREMYQNFKNSKVNDKSPTPEELKQKEIEISKQLDEVVKPLNEERERFEREENDKLVTLELGEPEIVSLQNLLNKDGVKNWISGDALIEITNALGIN